MRLHTRATLAREAREREGFVRRRFRGSPSKPELMDLTRFMHGGPGELHACGRCGVAVRREDAPEAHYENDTYDHDVLNSVYPRYRQAFAAKADFYIPLLPARAEVVEIGSHTGAFLEAAESWGWRATGLDIGADTSAFARKRGLSVRRECLHRTTLKAGSASAIFLWNCFEQLPDPGETLRDAHGLLKRDGLIVVRVPNLAFYLQQQRRRGMLSLAHNNLLGFPYQLGYTPATLQSTLRRGGFEPIGGVDSYLLTLPFPQWTAALEREQRKTRVEQKAATPEKLSGPWIEMICRRSGEQRRKSYVY